MLNQAVITFNQKDYAETSKLGVVKMLLHMKDGLFTIALCCLYVG